MRARDAFMRADARADVRGGQALGPAARRPLGRSALPLLSGGAAGRAGVCRGHARLRVPLRLALAPLAPPSWLRSGPHGLAAHPCPPRRARRASARTARGAASVATAPCLTLRAHPRTVAAPPALAWPAALPAPRLAPEAASRRVRRRAVRPLEAACTRSLIIGGGPAGLTAGMYCRMRKMSVLVLDAGRARRAARLALRRQAGARLAGLHAHHRRRRSREHARRSRARARRRDGGQPQGARPGARRRGAVRGGRARRR